MADFTDKHEDMTMHDKLEKTREKPLYQLLSYLKGIGNFFWNVDYNGYEDVDNELNIVSKLENEFTQVILYIADNLYECWEFYKAGEAVYQDLETKEMVNRLIKLLLEPLENYPEELKEIGYELKKIDKKENGGTKK